MWFFLCKDQLNLFLLSFQLRYLQTLNNISAEKNSTIVFPVPVDIISQLMGPSKEQQQQQFMLQQQQQQQKTAGTPI